LLTEVLSARMPGFARFLVALSPAPALRALLRSAFHPAAALRAPVESLVFHVVAAAIVRLAFVKVAPLITIEVVGRMVCTVGRLAASAGAEFSDAPFLNGCFSFRGLFPLPVVGLPEIRPDPLRVGDRD